MEFDCIAGAYGVVTMPFSVREGINIFLSGFVPTENLRFREEALTFKVHPDPLCPSGLMMKASVGNMCRILYFTAPPHYPSNFPGVYMLARAC